MCEISGKWNAKIISCAYNHENWFALHQANAKVITNLIYIHHQIHFASLLFSQFLADRTNGRAIATLLRLSSSSVCDVMYCG